MITLKRDRTPNSSTQFYFHNPETEKLSVNMNQRDAQKITNVLRQLDIPVDTSIFL